MGFINSQSANRRGFLSQARTLLIETDLRFCGQLRYRVKAINSGMVTVSIAGLGCTSERDRWSIAMRFVGRGGEGV